MASKLANKIEGYIKSAFPSFRYQKEKYVPYRNNRLFFDFYIPELKLYIEVQGQQHYSFNKFFHKDVEDFTDQKYRDSLKTEWANEEGFKLLKLSYDIVDKLTQEEFRQMVIKFI